MRFLILLVFLSACAIPKEDLIDVDSLSQSELRTVLLVRSGLEYYLKNRFIDSEFSFRQALEYYPDADNLKANLAASLAASGQTSEAKVLYSDLLLKEPENNYYIYGMAKVYELERDYQRALQLYKTNFNQLVSLDKVPDAVRLALEISKIEYKIGEETESVCFLKKAFDLGGDRNIELDYLRAAVLSNYPIETDLISEGLQLKALSNQKLFALALLRYNQEKYQDVLDIIEILDARKVPPALELELKFIKSMSNLMLAKEVEEFEILSEQQLANLPAKFGIDVEDLLHSGKVKDPKLT